MIRRLTLCLTVPALLLAACARPSLTPAELNKARVRQMIQELDNAPSAEVVARWLTSDYQLFMNGAPAMDLAGYQSMVKETTASFSNIKHDIHHLVAEGDTVAVGVTLHLTHTGVFDGIAATGRTITVEEFSVMRIRDGKVATEWAVVDLGGLRQQLSAPPPKG
ncbi:MAG TPA: ester cyclase [Vicinamibacterales bacterium]|nr:ester cyclase [Vicinamibacterales bacterium]